MASTSRSSPRVFATEIRRILRFIDRPELAVQLGLTREQLESHEARVGIDLWYDFIEAAAAASGDPFLGVHFGLQSHLGYKEHAGAMALVILASDTVRIAIDRTAHYQRFWNEAERYELAESATEFAVRWAPYGPPRPAHVQLAEKHVAQCLRFMRQAARGTVPLAVRFPHARRPGSEELARLFGCEPEFDRSITEIVFDPAVLEARLATANAVLFSVLDRHLAERVRDVTPASPVADRARKAIADHLDREQLSIDLVAKVLSTSERTLQRRLTDEQTSFRGLVDEVRRSRALALIRSGATTAELLVLLGYAEKATFYKAFRRWTGATPEVWRSQAARAGEA